MRQLAKREQPQPSLLDSLVRRVRELAGRGGGEPADLREALEGLLADSEDEGATPFG